MEIEPVQVYLTVIMVDVRSSRRAARPLLDGVYGVPTDSRRKSGKVAGAGIISKSSVGAQPGNRRRALFLDMSLPGGDSSFKKRFRKVDSFWRKTHKWRLRAAAAVSVTVFVVVGCLVFKGYLKVHRVFKGGQTAASLQTNVDPSLLKGEGDGRINILMLGKGGPGHDGPDLTDTMLILSVDPVNQTAALLSIPRDLWVNVPGYWSMKINAAYANAKYKAQAQGKTDKQADAIGISVAEDTVKQVLDIPINYYAMVDFTAFEKAVDTVGGVRIDVPQTLYDPTMAWQNHWNPVLAAKGWQNFNGYNALLYVRSRETSSDFARTERQRQLIVAIEQKVFTLGTFANPVKISSLMDDFGNHAQMDMSISDAMRFYKIMQGIDVAKLQSIGLSTPPHNLVTTGAVGNQSVVKPIAGLGNYSAIQDYVHSTLRDGYIVKENAQVAVLNGTKSAGLDARETALLKTYGYNVFAAGTAPTSDYQRTIVVDLTHGTKKYTANYLSKRFSTKDLSALPSGVQTNGADFVIIVGSDETTSSKN